MSRWTRSAALAVLVSASSLTAADQALTIVPGEWTIELKQKGGATYKDSTSASGFSGVNDERVLQSSKTCIGADKAVLKPEMFAPNCVISNIKYEDRSFDADLSCPNPAMTMEGSLSITTYDDGKKVVGTQVVTGGGDKVGSVIINTLTMTRVGECGAR